MTTAHCPACHVQFFAADGENLASACCWSCCHVGMVSGIGQPTPTASAMWGVWMDEALTAGEEVPQPTGPLDAPLADAIKREVAQRDAAARNFSHADESVRIARRFAGIRSITEI